MEMDVNEKLILTYEVVVPDYRIEAFWWCRPVGCRRAGAGLLMKWLFVGNHIHVETSQRRETRANAIEFTCKRWK